MHLGDGTQLTAWRGKIKDAGSHACWVICELWSTAGKLWCYNVTVLISKLELLSCCHPVNHTLLQRWYHCGSLLHWDRFLIMPASVIFSLRAVCNCIILFILNWLNWCPTPINQKEGTENTLYSCYMITFLDSKVNQSWEIDLIWVTDPHFVFFYF